MAISDKLTYLNTTKGKIKDSINLTGANIGSNDTFRSYAVKLRDGLLNVLNNGTIVLYNNFPKVSGTGSNISLTNTLEAPMFINKLDGDTKQSILPSGYTQVDYIESSGTQYIKTGYKLNANTNVVSKCYVSDFSLSRNYICGTLSGSPAKNRYQICFGAITSSFNTMWCRDENVHRFSITPPTKPFDITTSGENITIDGTTYTYTDTQAFDSNAKELYLMAVNNNGSASDIGNGVRLYSFKIYESSSLLHNYIPCYRNSDNEIGMYDIVNNVFYTNQGTGSFTYGAVVPSPDSPLEIQSVEGIQNVEISGKNLINFSKTPFVLNNTKDYLFENDILKIESVTGGTYQNFWWEIGDLKDYAGKILTLSYESANISGTNARKVIAIGKCDNNHNNRVNIVQVYENYNSATAIIPEPDETYTKLIVGFWVSLNNTTNDGNYTEYIKPQLEIGDNITSYEPYKAPQTYEVNLGQIKLYNGDYITGTPDNWSIVRNNGSVILNGSESYSSMEWNGGKYAYRTSINNLKQITSADEMTNVLTTYYKPYSFNGLYNSTEKYGVCNRINKSEIIIRNDDCTTSGSLQTWLSNNNVEVVYKLDTPTTTPITDTYLISQLNALYNAKSYNGQTNITVSGNLPMILEVSALKGE